MGQGDRVTLLGSDQSEAASWSPPVGGGDWLSKENWGSLGKEEGSRQNSVAAVVRPDMSGELSLDI